MRKLSVSFTLSIFSTSLFFLSLYLSLAHTRTRTHTPASLDLHQICQINCVECLGWEAGENSDNPLPERLNYVRGWRVFMPGVWCGSPSFRESIRLPSFRGCEWARRCWGSRWYLGGSVCVCLSVCVRRGKFTANRSVITDRSWREARTPCCRGNLITALRQTAGRRKTKVRRSNLVMTLRLCTHTQASIAALWQHTIVSLN